MWSLLEKEIASRLPLRDVTWRSPISNSTISIDRLPLRCLPISATLFKDTDHPFRWFLAPYIYIYIFVCETLDAYKTEKAKLKPWVDSHTGLKRSSWLLLYVPMGSQAVEVYHKIFNRLSSDFYNEKSGDRSSILFLGGFFRGTATNSSQALTEVMNKIKDGVVLSFQHRFPA